MLHAGLQDIADVFRRLASDSSEFELDFAAFQTFARSMASRMDGAAADADAAGMSQSVFASATNTITGLPKLTFQAFLAVRAHAGWEGVLHLTFTDAGCG